MSACAVMEPARYNMEVRTTSRLIILTKGLIDDANSHARVEDVQGLVEEEVEEVRALHGAVVPRMKPSRQWRQSAHGIMNPHTPPHTRSFSPWIVWRP